MRRVTLYSVAGNAQYKCLQLSQRLRGSLWRSILAVLRQLLELPTLFARRVGGPAGHAAAITKFWEGMECLARGTRSECLRDHSGSGRVGFRQLRRDQPDELWRRSSTGS